MRARVLGARHADTPGLWHLPRPSTTFHARRYALGLGTTSDEAAGALRRYDRGSARRLALPEFRRLVLELRRSQRPVAAAAGGYYDGGWQQGVEKTTGDVYYYNRELGRTQWDPPPGWGVDGGAGAAAKAASLAPAPAGGATAAAPALTADQIDRVFRRHDVDRSGDIDLSELKECLHELRMSVDTAQSAQVLERAPWIAMGDRDGWQSRWIAIAMDGNRDGLRDSERADSCARAGARAL